MNIKVEQWRRDKYGNIFEIINSTQVNNLKGKLGKLLDVKVKDTPKELIEVGDIIEYYYINVDGTKTKVIKDFVYEEGLESIYSGICYGGVKIVITKILTPNEDESVYTEQWRINNE